MEKPIPMDRIICGDVGYGKTEVAVPAFKAAQDGKQVAILVPTTLLSHQHQATFSERMARLSRGGRAELSRFTGAAEAEVDDGRHRRRQRRFVIETYRTSRPCGSRTWGSSWLTRSSVSGWNTRST